MPLLWGDMVRMVESMTKWASQIERVEDLPNALRCASKIATTPPTGPVFLALPMDIMMAEGDLQQALKEALQRPGPSLIDVPLEADFPSA